MPLEYPTGVVKEHTAVRERVGAFDVSHLGKLTVRGPGAHAFINSVMTNDLDRVRPGQAQYTLCCDDATGGIVDDLIVYMRADDDLLLVPNAANTAEVLRRLEAVRPEGVTIADEHRSHAVIAVQGARSDEVLDELGLPTGHDYMSFVEAPYGGADVVVCRTGYTGERGYELIAPNAVAGQLWDAVLAAGADLEIVPCGLGARDTLRTEMGYPLHGQDLGPQITPNMALIGWAVGWNKPAFWGREVLSEQKAAGVPRVLRGLVAVGRGIPRPGMRVIAAPDGPELGAITSGTFSPTKRQGIALALVDKAVEYGSEVYVDIRGRAEAFTLTRPPFVQTQVRKS
jgi:aminomethyltransferase